MPAGDRSGPRGQGPMTGRAVGYCAGYDAPGYAYGGPGWGRGLGFRWGRGWGFRHGWHYAPPPPYWGPPVWGTPPYPTGPAPEEELDALNAQAEWLQKQLDDIQQRIDTLNPKE